MDGTFGAADAYEGYIGGCFVRSSSFKLIAISAIRTEAKALFFDFEI